MPIPLKVAREIGGEPRKRGMLIDDAVVSRQPVAWLRDAVAWIRKHSKPRKGRMTPLAAFVESRAGLRRCAVCGCTEDNACIDRRTGQPCRWVKLSLCSACTL